MDNIEYKRRDDKGRKTEEEFSTRFLKTHRKYFLLNWQTGRYKPSVFEQYGKKYTWSKEEKFYFTTPDFILLPIKSKKLPKWAELKSKFPTLDGLIGMDVHRYEDLKRFYDYGYEDIYYIVQAIPGKNNRGLDKIKEIGWKVGEFYCVKFSDMINTKVRTSIGKGLCNGKYIDNLETHYWHPSKFKLFKLKLLDE